MPRQLQSFVMDVFRSLAEFGVHITYQDLYGTVVFLVCIYVSGEIAKRVFRMPSLVGEIFCGILLGPPVLEDFVPFPEAWVMFGELGLVLLVIEAGIDIDVSTLKLIGTTGFLIAIVGSILPIGIAMLITWILNVTDTIGIIATGCVFGPTSLGIALNILRGGGILNTPVGQLIISAAVIDDMIALVILSQLKALQGEITVASIMIPIVSALSFLIIGGCVAVFVLPQFIAKHILVRFKEEHHDQVEMTIMFLLVLLLMPATYYAQASYLMGSFIAGLAFCSSHGLHHLFVRQFKRLLQWLMRIFFAASIGFQVPITHFGNPTIIWQGLVYTLALTGKVAVGLMVPNFTTGRRFHGNHLRDCLITGFSMAAEGEFAFVIAVFAVDGGLIHPDLYASIVLAVLLSTIIPPFLLRFTIAYYTKKSLEAVERAAEHESMRKHQLGHDVEASLVEGIRTGTTVFLCIQTQSESRWGLLPSIMAKMGKLGLEIIDHRAWSPQGINTTLVNEVYARGTLDLETTKDPEEALNVLMGKVKTGIEEVINQPETSKVKVQRWYPGVVEEICEKVDEKRRKTVTQSLLNEASAMLERKQELQTTATKQKTIAELMGVGDAAVEKPLGDRAEEGPENGDVVPGIAEEETHSKPRRRVRRKMRSTPVVVGGGLFGEQIEARSGREEGGRGGTMGDFAAGTRTTGEDLQWLRGGSLRGVSAEITVRGQTYNIRISRETWKDLQKGYGGYMLDSRGVEMSGINIAASNEDAPIVQRLQGFVRTTTPLNEISEETVEDASDMESVDPSAHNLQV